MEWREPGPARTVALGSTRPNVRASGAEKERAMMGRRSDPVLAAWVIGVVLAVLVYVLGPKNFLFHLVDTFHVLMWRLDAVRALAIGLYATFLVLGFAVLRRGGRARAALIVVTILFLVLVMHDDTVSEGNGRWTAALALSAVGAIVMTARLRQTALVLPRTY
jgi:uncharacterized integral membrane protein